MLPTRRVQWHSRIGIAVTARAIGASFCDKTRNYQELLTLTWDGDMFFHQFYDQALAQASYLIGCQATGEAIVIDALRDPGPYLAVAAREGLRITHCTETHIHADFVSGARELCAATGAQLFLSAEGGRDWQYAFAAADHAVLLHDGDRITVGNLHFDVLHTPGHTPEHLSFIVTDTPAGVGPMGIVTGDFVFVGDVGRPDLLEKAAKIANTMEEGAHTLFQSLQRFRALPDHLQVWPGHGAGSACGKSLGAVPSSTVGYEKRANWGVATTDEGEFVRMVLEGQPEPPRYFAEMKRINRDGPPILGAPATATELPPTEVLGMTDSSLWLIDLRPAAEFAASHIPRSLSVPSSRSFSTYVGSIVPYAAEIVLLADGEGEAANAQAQSCMHDLSLIGLDRVRGWMPAGAALAMWGAAERPLATVVQHTTAEFHAGAARGATILDVRGQTEWEAGHMPGARHIPLGDVVDRWRELPEGAVLVHCQAGGRSAIAASLLQRLGKEAVSNLQGGYAAWRTVRDAVSADLTA